MQPAKSVPRSLLVNRFAVLDIEEVNTNIREPIDTPPLSPSALDRTAQPWKPKCYPNNSPSISSTLVGRRSSCQ